MLLNLGDGVVFYLENIAVETLVLTFKIATPLMKTTVLRREKCNYTIIFQISEKWLVIESLGRRRQAVYDLVLQH